MVDAVLADFVLVDVVLVDVELLTPTLDTLKPLALERPIDIDVAERDVAIELGGADLIEVDLDELTLTTLLAAEALICAELAALAGLSITLLVAREDVCGEENGDDEETWANEVDTNEVDSDEVDANELLVLAKDELATLSDDIPEAKDDIPEAIEDGGISLKVPAELLAAAESPPPPPPHAVRILRRRPTNIRLLRRMISPLLILLTCRTITFSANVKCAQASVWSNKNASFLPNYCESASMIVNSQKIDLYYAAD